MKKMFVLSVLLILITAQLFAQFEIKLGNELFITKLNDRIYVVTHYFPWESNSLIVCASNDDVVLIDTPYTPEGTAMIMDWIIETLKPQKITGINTGYHVDNLGGNQYLREKGIDIYGSDRTCTLVDERGKQTQELLISWLKPEQENIKKVAKSHFLPGYIAE